MTALRDEIEGILGSVKDNFRDVVVGGFTDDEILEEADVIVTLSHLLSIWQHVEPYILDEAFKDGE